MFGKVRKVLRFLKNYKLYSYGYLIAIVLNIFFEIVSIATVIPFLQIIFNDASTVINDDVPELSLSISAIVEFLQYHFNTIIVEKGRGHALFLICIAIVILFFFKNIVRYLSLYLLAPIRNGIVRDLRAQVFEKISRLPLYFLNDKKKGDIITRVTSDIHEIQVSVVQVIESLIKDPLMILTSLLTMLFISPSLTVTVILVLPAGAWIISKIVKKLKKSTVKGQERLGDLITILEEVLSGLKIIKAYNVEEQQQDKFGRINDQNYKIQNRILRVHPLGPVVSEFLGITILTFILYYGGVLVIDKTEGFLEGSTLIFYLILFGRMISPAKTFSYAMGHLKKGEASIDRVFELIDVEVEDDTKLTDLASFKSSIEFKAVSFAYKEETILKQVSFNLEKGKKIALVGHSGSGKSTIAELIPKFYSIKEGDILIDGQSISDLSGKSIRANIGMVTQEAILFNDSVYNNIAFGKQVSEEEVINAAKLANAHEFIKDLEQGYRTNIGDRGGKLSGGQKQRLTIARAILKNPPIMILDEATSALDTESELNVQEAIEKLMEDRTSLIIAHRLSTIQNADEIIVLDKGEVKERGNHQQLMEMKGLYHNFVTLQSFEQ